MPYGRTLAMTLLLDYTGLLHTKDIGCCSVCLMFLWFSGRNVKCCRCDQHQTTTKGIEIYLQMETLPRLCILTLLLSVFGNIFQMPFEHKYA